MPRLFLHTLFPVAALGLLLTACTAQPPRPAAAAGSPEAAAAPASAVGRYPVANAGQLVVVTASGWDATEGELQRFERDDMSWHRIGAPEAVSLGRSGLAWGQGRHAMPQGDGPIKREGDGRSPAGVFDLPGAFGYGPTGHSLMPYEAMDASDWCMDVDTSPFYNRIIDARQEGEAAVAGSSEPMRLDLHNAGDDRYALGLKVAHNPANVPGQGSCIFMHLWRRPGETTAGCTAMSDSTMLTLLSWLDPQRHPVLVLLPEAEYARLRSAWNLPAVQVSR